MQKLMQNSEIINGSDNRTSPTVKGEVEGAIEETTEGLS